MTLVTRPTCPGITGRMTEADQMEIHMCGIAGWADFSGDLTSTGADRATAEAMSQTLTCRGPDGNDLWFNGRVALAQTRLAVIDIEGGHQPMVAEEDGRQIAVLAYKGEIYNFKSLRTELEGRGHRFRTRSDTEVVLRAYLEWGADCPKRLEGMFGMAVWDLRNHTLFLARDRIGIKPLYYSVVGDAVLFGSEPKALLAHPAIRPIVNADGLREVFSEARIPGATPYRDISSLRPGTSMTVRAGHIEHRTYWQIAARPHEADLETTISEIRDLLDDVVAREMVADVPVGIALSGGLDSSAMTALAARRTGAAGKVRSVTVTFPGYSENFQPDLVRSAPDAPYARELSEHVGTEHLEVTFPPHELMDPEARLACLRAHDMPSPFGDMDTASYLGYRAVREHTKVLLIGEVADEIFGGYSWIHIPDLAEEPMFPWVAFEKWHPGTRDGLGRSLFDKGLLDKLDFEGYYAAGYQEALAEVPNLDGDSPEARRQREICYLHLTRWLPMLLDRNDRLSMATGLEVRVPYCDHRLVEYLYNVPWEMKTFDGREKSLLRAATAHLLPKSIVERPKSPFPVSQDPEYTRALHAELQAVLADPNSPVTPFVDSAAVKELVELVEEGESQDWLYRMNVEMVLQFNTWLTHYDVQFDL